MLIKCMLNSFSVQLVPWQIFGPLSTWLKKADSKGFRGPIGNIQNLNMKEGPMKNIGIEGGVYASLEVTFLSTQAEDCFHSSFLLDVKHVLGILELWLH